VAPFLRIDGNPRITIEPRDRPETVLVAQEPAAYAMINIGAARDVVQDVISLLSAFSSITLDDVSSVWMSARSSPSFGLVAARALPHPHWVSSAPGDESVIFRPRRA